MKILYDMSTGRIIEAPGKTRKQPQQPAQEIQQLPALRLHQTDVDSRGLHRITPDLAITDVDQV